MDQASNDSGKHGEICGRVRAAYLIDNLNLPPEHVQDAADRLRRLCSDGTMTAIDGRNWPIPAIDWRHLVLDSEVVYRGQSSSVPAYHNVVFSRVDVLREFPPERPSEDQDVTATPAVAETNPTSRDAVAPGETGNANYPQPRNRRKKGSPVRDKIIANMQNAIDAREITLDGIHAMRDEDRADRFGTKKRPANGTINGAHPQRTYVAEALNILLSRSQSRQIAKNDK